MPRTTQDLTILMTGSKRAANLVADGRNRHAPLFGRIALADGHRLVLQRLAIDGDAERRADFVLPGVTATDAAAFVVVGSEMFFQ